MNWCFGLQILMKLSSIECIDISMYQIKKKIKKKNTFTNNSFVYDFLFYIKYSNFGKNIHDFFFCLVVEIHRRKCLGRTSEIQALRSPIGQVDSGPRIVLMAKPQFVRSDPGYKPLFGPEPG